MVDRETQRDQLEHLEISIETSTVGERIVGLGRKIRSPRRRCHDNGTNFTDRGYKRRTRQLCWRLIALSFT